MLVLTSKVCSTRLLCRSSQGESRSRSSIQKNTTLYRSDEYSQTDRRSGVSMSDQLSGRCCIDLVNWRLLSECSFLYLRWWLMLQRYAAKESLRNFWRALLSLPRMNFPVGRLLGHGQNGERTRHHRAASKASV
jgi:hypothetical protein